MIGWQHEHMQFKQTARRVPCQILLSSLLRRKYSSVSAIQVIGHLRQHLSEQAEPAEIATDVNLKFCDIDPCSSDSDLSDVFQEAAS